MLECAVAAVISFNLGAAPIAFGLHLRRELRHRQHVERLEEIERESADDA